MRSMGRNRCRTYCQVEETARYFLHAVRGNYLADGTTERGAVLNRLLGYPDARTLYET